MTNSTDNMTPAQRAVADAAFEEAFEATRQKLLAISALPGVSVAQAADFVAAGMDVDDVRRLAPEEVMRRAFRPQ